MIEIGIQRASEMTGPLKPEPNASTPSLQFALSIATADQCDLVNAAANVAVTFSPAQLAGASKAVQVELKGTKSASLCVWSTRSVSGFQTRPRALEGKVTIRFVDSGAMSRGLVGGRESLAIFDQAIFAPFGEMSLADTTPGFSSLSASIDHAALLKKQIALSGTPIVALPQFDQVVDARTPRMKALRGTLDLLQGHLREPRDVVDLVTPLLEELIAYQILCAWPITHDAAEEKVSLTSDRSIRLALEFIEANIGARIEISDIASAADVSARWLQMAFKTRLGCSPISFLIGRRLDKVRAALLQHSHMTITQIARQWGFSHMSDFSQRYSARFGELPRDTKAALSKA